MTAIGSKLSGSPALITGGEDDAELRHLANQDRTSSRYPLSRFLHRHFNM